MWLEHFHSFGHRRDGKDAAFTTVEEDFLLLGEDLLSESRDAEGSNVLTSRIQLRESGLLEAERVHVG